MADKKSLELIGLAFGLVTAAVVLMAAVVVTGQLDRSVAGERPVVVSAATGGLIR